MYKIEASAAQIANCILLHIIHLKLRLSQLAAITQLKQNINCLKSWYNNIFDYKLRTD